MKQITLQDNQLNLKVKKCPLFIRIVLFPISFLFFLFPIMGMLASLIDGSGITFYSLIFLVIFLIMGFYLLRISLWNTFGEEIIKISNNKVTYEASYKWFKDGKKEIDFNTINYLIKPIGYENTGVLVFESENDKIESVIQIPIIELEHLLTKLPIMPRKTN